MKTDYRLLIINPGSTSTKVALYQGCSKVVQESISHSADELAGFETLPDQVPYRLALIESFMKRNNISPESLDAVIGRGGLVFGIKTGGYRVNDKLAKALASDKYSSPHASNLGGILAKTIADEGGKPAFIYDAVTSSELPEVAKITGIKEIHRESQCHVLNSRAMAMRCAKDLGKKYSELDILVAHLGGGISASAHHLGHIIDTIGDCDGPFSPERAGSVPGLELVELCFSGKYTKQEMKKKVRGKGGMYAHLGTSSCLEIEERIANGDKYAELVFQAQALQIAKCVGELSVVFKKSPDCIVLTGGIAYSEKLMAMVKDYISFIGPVYVYPGELEMEALAEGGIRMLSGEESFSEYDFPQLTE